MVEEKVKVTFILGILNAERTLEECLNSILMQNYPKDNYEILIVDGGSTDRTLEIIDRYMEKESNIRLMHNPHKLSEGRGMSKDMGVEAARGEVVIFIDHDNILLGDMWLQHILRPFEDHKIMASQSLLESKSGGTIFLDYINDIGVEDPFAFSYSLVGQVQTHPEKFEKSGVGYAVYQLDSENDLFGGANGCAFRKSVFDKIGGYTRDLDVFASMAELNMKVAVPLKAKLHHKTSNSLGNFMKKKGIYFYRFIKNDYEEKKFNWVRPGLKGKAKFFLMVLSNLTLVVPTAQSVNRAIKTKRVSWLMHPAYLFFVTLEYGLITSLKMSNFLTYAGSRKRY